jgi:cell division protein FtsW
MQNAGAYFRSWFGRFERLSVRRPDPWLAGPGVGLIVLGLLMVLDTTYFLGQEKSGDGFHYFKLQLAHVGVGLLVCALLSQFSLAGLRRIAMPLAIVSLVMLLLVWVPGFGAVRGGARRWVRLGPLLAEPSELLKLTWVFFLATFLAKRQERIDAFASAPGPAFGLVTLLAMVTLAQPDFGATVMLVLLLFAMLYAAGARLKHLAIPGGGALAIFALLAVAKPYRWRRLAGFVDPWRTARGAGFQLIQSFIALGAGGGWGQGLGVGRQKMFFLPQAHTDFVFAVVAEDFGIAGAIVVFALFILILVRGMRIARAEPDPFASLLAAGLTLLLSLQALINLAVVIGLVPTKGLPLPFVSYGGTSMVMMLAALGALLALSRRPAVQ